MKFMLSEVIYKRQKKIHTMLLITTLAIELTLTNMPVTVLAAEQASVSGNKIEQTISIEETSPSPVEVVVPIYNYDITNIVAPARFAVALNPYKLAIKTGDDTVSTEQIVSRMYGIINKSSTDKVVTVTLTVEDLNNGQIVFVDSKEEVEQADKDTYAVYLAAIPADANEIQIHGEAANQDTSSADLSDVSMTGAMDSAVALKNGENKIAFRLSKAAFDFENGSELALDAEQEGYAEDSFKLSSLAPEGGGVTAFTFSGAINPKADWGKLLKGVRISAVYTYETASEEKILEGTGAMIEPE